MKLISKVGKAKEAAQRWKEQYKLVVWKDHCVRGREVVYNQLIALGTDPQPCDVDKVIGNTSWTYVSCDECKCEVEVVIQLGQEPDWESATASICFSCLEKAITLIQGESQ